MMTGLLLGPKYVIPNEYRDRRIYFLAGPIRGGGQWQMRAAELLWEKSPGCVVADPSRWETTEKAAASETAAERIKLHRSNSIGKWDGVKYPNQASWESEHMRLASETGTLLFWLPKQSTTGIRPKKDGVYAQDSRVEIGIWIERVKNNPSLNVRIGGDWEIDANGYETENSFGGMNFIAYYLTGVKDRRALYESGSLNKHFVRASDLESFINSL